MTSLQHTDSEEPSRRDNRDTRCLHTCMDAECGKGGRGRGERETQYIGQGADESVVLGPRFITCVSIVSR